MTIKNEANNMPDADAADESNPLGADMWLHIASDCLRRFARHHPVQVAASASGLTITLCDIQLEDGRLHRAFAALTISNSHKDNQLKKI